MEIICCGRNSNSRKDKVAKKPLQNYYDRKSKVSEQFRQILRASYHDHKKGSQARKKSFSFRKIRGKHNIEKSSIYEMQEESQARKNKTLKELRNAVLNLLEQIKGNNSGLSKGADKKPGTQEVLFHKMPQPIDYPSKAVSAHLHETDKVASEPSNEVNEISPSRANDLDLMNFISQMKHMEGVSDGDMLNQQRMQGPSGMGMNGLNGNQASRDDMFSTPFSSPMNQMYNPAILPKNKMNQWIENSLPELKDRYKFLQQQSGSSPYVGNNLISRSDLGQYAIATPETSSIPLGNTGLTLFNSPQIPYQQTSPYLPIDGPSTPYLPLRHEPFTYGLNGEESAGDFYDDDADDDGEDLEDAQPRYLEDDDADFEDGDDDRYGPEEDR